MIMKILMYSTGYLFGEKQTGGIKRFIELTKYLQNEYNADLCCADSMDVLLKNGLRSTYQIKPVMSRKFRWAPPEARIAFENRSIIKTIKSENYDYIISFDVPPTISLCLFKVPNIVLMIRKDLIGYFDITHKNKSLKSLLKRKFLKLCEGICLKGSKRIVTQCEYDKLCLQERHPLIANKVYRKFAIQINNVNPSWIRDTLDKEEKKDDIYRIGFIGNFNDSRKGHDIFLESAQLLLNKYKNLFFYIVGAGKTENYYKNKYECERIIFLGHQKAPWKSLSMIDLNVVPSLADSCPNTVMESLYYGIPVIGSNVGGIPEILCDKQAIFEPDCKSITEKIEMLINDTQSYEMLKETQTKRRMELTFDWAQMIFDKIRCD